MGTGQTLIVVRAVDRNVTLDVLAEFFADRGEDLFLAIFAHSAVGKVSVHAASVPVRFAERLRMQVDRVAMLFGGAFEHVPREPGFITRALSGFGKDLEFPLARRHFGVDTLDVETGFETLIQVLFDDVAPVGVFRAD